MKKYRIMVAVFLFAVILPVAIACLMAYAFGSEMLSGSDKKELEALLRLYGNNTEKINQFMQRLTTFTNSALTLTIVSVPALLGAGLNVLIKGKKENSVLTSTAIVLSVFIWALINKSFWYRLSLDIPSFDVAKYGDASFGRPIDGVYTAVVYLLIIPVLGLLAISIFQKVMLKKNASVTSVPVENIEENIQANISSDENNIELLKKYKQLLDDNAITQEEFDAKKKQLLGL